MEFFKDLGGSSYRIASTPTEGCIFEVNPSKIDWTLFEKKRRSKKQEELRKRILSTYEEIKINPEYLCTFYTYIAGDCPMWSRIGGCDERAVEFAKKLGGQINDRHRQILELAQRISNGESWADVCNVEDTILYSRMILSEKWKDVNYSWRYTFFVGGGDNPPAHFYAPSDHDMFCIAAKKAITSVVFIEKE